MFFEKGQFPKSQFEDLVNAPNPPQAGQEEPVAMEASEAEPPALNAAQCLERARAAHEPRPAPPRPAPVEAPESAEAAPSSVAPSSAVGDTYGPIRRISGKSRPEPGIVRPPEMQAETFIEMMSELVPQNDRRSAPERGAILN